MVNSSSSELISSRCEMKKILIYPPASLILAIVASISASYASGNINTNTNDSRVFSVENNLQSPTTRWRIVKHAFQIHIPKNIDALSQLIIDTPSTVAVSNDINTSDQNGRKINTNASVDGRKIIVFFPKKDISNTKLLVELNKVKQPTFGSDSIYSLSAKVVGNDSEIPVGVARFRTF